MIGIFFQRRSLKTKIALATLAIFLAGIWSLSIYISQMLRGEMQNHLGEQQFATASIVATQINNEMEIRFDALKMAADMIVHAMQEGQTSPKAFVEHLTPLHILFNGGFSVHDAKGDVIAGYPGVNGEQNLHHAETDVVAMAVLYGKSSLSHPVARRKTTTPVIVMAVPIKTHSGQIIGALSSAIDLEHDNFLNHITDNRYGKNGGYLIISPQHRVVVSATDKTLIMQKIPAPGKNPHIDQFNEGYEGSLIFTNPEGVEILTSSKRIPAAGWRIAVVLPTSEAFAPIDAVQKHVLVVTMLLSVLAGALIWWLLLRGLSPLVDTANTLAGMANGSRPFHPLPITGNDEIGQLIGGFNHLLGTLEQREALLKQILDTSSVAIFLMDKEFRITQANQCMAEMFKRPIESLVGCDYVSLIHPSEHEATQMSMQRLRNEELLHFDLDRLYQRDDRTRFWGRITAKNLYDASGDKKGMVAVISDIDMRKRAEQRLQLVASVFTHAREGIMITKADGTIIDVNASFTRITGYTSEEMLGNKNPLVASPDHPEHKSYDTVRKALDSKGEWSGEAWNRRKNGEIYAEMRTITAVRNADGVVQHYVSLFSDITPFKEHERQLEHMAHFDVLTGLPNRALLADRLQHAIAQTQRHRQLLAVAYLDLDGFKTVNDRHGHEAGDQLLIALSQRMKKALREGDTLARLGGDEFVAVLHDLKEPAASTAMLNRLLAAAAQPLPIGSELLQVSASLGVTFYPQAESVDADQLLRQADQAMYQAKLAGKNRYHVFDDEQDRNVRGHHESLQRIREALKNNEFILFFQPKVNMRTGQVIGAEALIRWQHPEKGLLSPAVFLPAIENHAIAVDVGEWVIDAALTTSRQWREAGLSIPVSVNVGARQLQHPNFVSRLKEIVARHPTVQPGDLELEVLETSALEDVIGVSELIRDCRELGVTFALDDFGTGYSSLTYLKRLPVATLKIDQSFVSDMLDEPENLPILDGIINLALAFHRDVIAEGVETPEHGKLLLQLGCQQAQGYGIAHPMPAADFPAWAKTWNPGMEWPQVRAVDHEELPILFSSIQHRAWVTGVEKYLRDQIGSMPQQDPHRCRFGRWLDEEGEKIYGKKLGFQAIKLLHEQVHQVADELCTSKRDGTLDNAEEKLKELRDLHDSVLQRLRWLGEVDDQG